MSVIGVQPVPLPRVVPEHHVGADPADPVGHFPPLAQTGFELAVWPAEERDFALATEAAGCLALLLLAHGDQPGRVFGWVPRSLGTVSADQVMDPASRGRPLGQGAAASELDVVRMRPDRQGHRRRGKVHGRPASERAMPHRVAHGVSATRSSGTSTSQARGEECTTRIGSPSRWASSRCRANDPGP